MNKFEKVKKALEEKTKNTDNFITITKNVDARHNGKYTIQNVVTRSTLPISFKTLDAVIKEYDLF